MKKFNIVMESGGGTVREFWGGFETEEEAITCAKKQVPGAYVLLVSYGPQDEFGDKEELSAVRV